MWTWIWLKWVHAHLQRHWCTYLNYKRYVSVLRLKKKKKYFVSKLARIFQTDAACGFLFLFYFFFYFNWPLPPHTSETKNDWKISTSIFSETKRDFTRFLSSHVLKFFKKSKLTSFFLVKMKKNNNFKKKKWKSQFCKIKCAQKNKCGRQLWDTEFFFFSLMPSNYKILFILLLTWDLTQNRIKICLNNFLGCKLILSFIRVHAIEGYRRKKKQKQKNKTKQKQKTSLNFWGRGHQKILVPIGDDARWREGTWFLKNPLKPKMSFQHVQDKNQPIFGIKLLSMNVVKIDVKQFFFFFFFFCLFVFLFVCLFFGFDFFFSNFLSGNKSQLGEDLL